MDIRFISFVLISITFLGIIVRVDITGRYSRVKTCHVLWDNQDRACLPLSANNLDAWLYVAILTFYTATKYV